MHNDYGVILHRLPFTDKLKTLQILPFSTVSCVKVIGGVQETTNMEPTSAW